MRCAQGCAATISEADIASRDRVIVFGGFGQVGEALVAAAADAGHDPEGVVQLGRGDVDITDATRVEELLQDERARAAVNCAVFQPVDRCETETDQAFRVNSMAAGALAHACKRASTRLVHLSTDYVFGGPRRVPYRESDLPAPQSVYAASKLAGEHLVLAASQMHTVVRTSAVYGNARQGHGTPPFIERMLERARQEAETRVVNDQVVSPTYALDLASAIWGLLGCGACGLFHVANQGQATWFEVAEIAFEAVGARRHLGPTTAVEFGAPAKRPDYSALDNAALRQLGLHDLPHWREAMGRYFAANHPDLTPPL